MSTKDRFSADETLLKNVTSKTRLAGFFKVKIKTSGLFSFYIY